MILLILIRKMYIFGRTLDVMVCGLSPERVGAYCELAEKHNIPLLSKACIRWLSFHFVTEMIDRIELGQLSLKTLLAVLCNKKLAFFITFSFRFIFKDSKEFRF